jgi:hypothetical protein
VSKHWRNSRTLTETDLRLLVTGLDEFGMLGRTLDALVRRSSVRGLSAIIAVEVEDSFRSAAARGFDQRQEQENIRKTNRTWFPITHTFGYMTLLSLKPVTVIVSVTVPLGGSKCPGSLRIDRALP